MNMIIAEIGSVHDGSYGNALKLIALAASCGADVAKFQTHIAEAETLKDAPSPSYFASEPRFDYFRRTGFTPDQWRGLKAECAKHGIRFLSSAFSIEAVDFLDGIGAEFHKVPSGEVTNLPLLERLAELGKPVLLSSGMSDWQELERAVAILQGKVDLTVMQCTSQYPCPDGAVGLNVLGEMRRRFGVRLGFSDHTNGPAAGIAAAALGAEVIEKHLTFSRAMYGSDAPNAMEPDDFSTYCAGIKEVWRILERPVDKNDLGPYRNMKLVFEKSLVAASDLAAGTVIQRAHLAFKKPGDGIPAGHYRAFLGRRLARAVPADHKFAEGDFS